MTTEIQRLQTAVATWATQTFQRGCNPMPSLSHLESEVQELLADPTNPDEYADCLLLILDAAARATVDTRLLMDAAWRKMEINQRRTWGKPNAAGFSEHVD